MFARACVETALLYIHEGDGIAVCGEDLGDTVAHETGADDRDPFSALSTHSLTLFLVSSRRCRRPRRVSAR